MKRSVEASRSAPTRPTIGGTTRSAGQNQPESGDRRVAEVGAQHVEDAVGEVHDAQDAEDEREAGGDEEEEPGERQRVEELLDEVGQHAGPSAGLRYENSSVRHFGVTLSPGYVARIFGIRCGYFGSFTASTANPGCTA